MSSIKEQKKDFIRDELTRNYNASRGSQNVWYVLNRGNNNAPKTQYVVLCP